MAAAVLRSRLPDWEFGQIFGSASVCVCLIYEVLRLISIQFLPLFLTENNAVNDFA